MIQAIGKLQSVSSEIRGNNFLVVDIEMDINGRPLSMQAKFDAAHRILALIGEAPQGSLVEVYANPEFRLNNDGDRVFMDLVANDALLLNNVGTPSATFRLQGFLRDIKAIPRKDGGTFEVGVFQPLAFNREGLPLLEAAIDVSMNDDEVETWRDNLGKFAFVRGSVSGYKTANKDTGKTRVWPRFQAISMSVMNVPSWLEQYSPEPSLNGVGPAGEEVVDILDGEIPF